MRGQATEEGVRRIIEGLDDLDRALLRALPDQGARLGKYLPDAPGVGELRKRLADPVLSTYLLSGRVKSLVTAGLAVKVGTGSKQMGYQRTKEGKERAETE